jgi:hypothetical protein
MPMPTGFKLSKSMREKLPEQERAGAETHLWEKSAGICTLCERPLPEDPKQIEPDHRVAEKEGSGGATTLANLYLAHTSCNRRRGNLTFEVAHPIIKFMVWAEHRPAVQFTDVVAQFVKGGNQKAQLRMEGDDAVLQAGDHTSRCTTTEDPATKTKYFFAEVPITHIRNDDKTQPRWIEPDHVRQLAIDFSKHPVHEPSNCRLVGSDGDVVELLQFDGQHKTTAQILLGRTIVPMKIYVNPDIAMIQELVVQIQQGIKKLPLSTSDTLRKLGDVLRARLETYATPPGKFRSEKGFIDAQPLELQKQVKKELFGDLQRAILFDDANTLRDYVSKGQTSERPLSDKVAITKLIDPFMCPQLLQDNIDHSSYGRDQERRTIVLILNTIVANILKAKWDGGDKADRRRVQNFFYQGSIGWWVNKVLIPATRICLLVPEEKKERMFLEQLDDEKQARLIKLVETLCSWDIWSTEAPDALKAMRSNTAKSVAEVFTNFNGKTYNDIMLVKTVRAGQPV